MKGLPFFVQRRYVLDVQNQCMGVKMEIEDLSGKRFGRLFVIKSAGKKSSVYLWSCVCDCGKSVVIRGASLRYGYTKSCGCLNIEKRKKNFDKTTHGHSKHGSVNPTFVSWSAMMNRCKNKSSVDFRRYGGRGILVCERWSKYENFLLDMGERPKGKTIDRIDVNGNYEQGNCRWASIMEQSNNRRSNRILSVNGSKITVADASRKYGINYETLISRITQRGWSDEKAVIAPIEVHRKRVPCAEKAK